MADADNAQRAPTAKLSLRSSGDIQGNILAPFNKPHQVFLFLSFRNDQASARKWLEALVNERRIAANNAVADHNDQHRAAKEEGGPTPPPRHWLNVGLTCSGLLTLHLELVANLAVYEAFWQGPLGERRDDRGHVTTTAALLGDEGRGDPAQWVIGGPGQRPVDAIMTIAADASDEDELIEKAVAKERERAADLGLRVLDEQRGDRLDGGRDHFGFKDNISQPGIRGFTEEAPNDPNTDRVHPGSLIIAAGEFLLGQPKEQRRDWRSRPPTTPDWMRDGSFQVFRRLIQDVDAWDQSMQRESRKVGITKEELAAKAIGRWPSGTPLELASERHTIVHRPNEFDFKGDPEGLGTPRFAHIRKMNPRNDEVFRDRAHRILRRGITFGRVEPEHGASEPRGLLFNAYMASIEDQFEFLQRHWANDPEVPSKYFQKAPEKDGSDPVIGKSTASYLLYLEKDLGAAAPQQKPDPKQVSFHASNGHHTEGGDFRPFVFTRGAVYAFAPRISVLGRLADHKPMSDGR